jgi:cell division protein FtsI (penicillin-binding protein 3)
VRRIKVAVLCVAVALSLFAGRLIQLQGLESARFRTEANQEWLKPISIPAVRGSITSSDGAVYAMTVQTDTVFADPQLIPAKIRIAVASQLAGPLKMPAATILSLLDHPPFGPDYVVLAQGVPTSTGNRIASLDEPGIDKTAKYSTVYPDDEAANVVGYTNQPDGYLAGAAGLEAEYNSLLAGRPGSEDVEEGPTGEPIPLTEQRVTAAVPARNLRLTIQSDIQYEADQFCKQRVEIDHARNCSIVVMTRTGQVLAMAQWPTFNPADLQSTANTSNISVADVFAPGSTLKPITVAAALEKGRQTPMSAYTIPYQIKIDDLYTFHDAEFHPTVRYTIAGILAHSSNVGMVQLVQHITPMQQYHYLRAFGLGSVSGINVGPPGAESAGLLPRPGTPGYWPDDPFEFSFGQGLAVTAIQMASVYATIANGGVRVQPTIVAGTTSQNGVFAPAPRPASRRVIQAKTARELMTILQQVPLVDAQAGEPWGIIRGYTVAAKTGTAQVSGVGGAKCLCQYGSSYIGIAPADNPQLVVAVNIQDPRGKYYGDEVAGPAFYEVMRFALATMKIPPDYAKTPYIRLTAP